MKNIKGFSINDTYSDPEGEWQILDIVYDQITVIQVQEDNINYGQLAIVEKKEVLYFMQLGGLI